MSEGSYLNVKVKVINFTKSVWLFPVILLFVILLLSILRISGSSVGEISQQFLSSSESDSSLLFGNPRNLRSDEWSVNTPLISSQQRNNFSLISSQLGIKNDTAVVSDIPSRDWTTLFKPQNVGFIIGIPFENAFALRWWLMGYILIVSVYFFTLHLFPGKRMFAAILALSLFFAPIIQWWYQNINILVVAYSFSSLLLFMKLVDTRKDQVKRKTIYSLSLAWSVIAFALILYPPYQIPLAYLTAIAAVTYLVINHKHKLIETIRQNVKYITLSLSIIIAVVGAFYFIHRTTLHLLSSTSYPGQRKVLAGDFPTTHLLGTSLAPLFVDEKKSKSYYPESGLGNSSESSQLGLPLLTVLLLVASSIAISIKKKRVPILTIVMLLVTILILLRLLVPHLNFLYTLTLINTIPHQRMVLALGVATFLLLIFCVYENSRNRINFNRHKSLIVNSINVLLSIGTLLILNKNLGWLLNDVHPFYLILLVVIMPVTLGLLFTYQKYTLMALTFLLFTFISTIHVNPLYIGFGESTNSNVSKAIHQLSGSNQGKWVTDFDKVWQLESLVLLNGAEQLSGVYIYPQNNIWENIDSSEQAKFAYNRFAHVTFTVSSGDSKKTSLKYESAMEFNISTTPCSDFLHQMNVRYVLTVKNLQSPCIQHIESYGYEKQNLHIYYLSYND